MNLTMNYFIHSKNLSNKKIYESIGNLAFSNKLDSILSTNGGIENPKKAKGDFEKSKILSFKLV